MEIKRAKYKHPTLLEISIEYFFVILFQINNCLMLNHFWTIINLVFNLFYNLCCWYIFLFLFIYSWSISIRKSFFLKIFFVTNQTMLETSLDWLSGFPHKASISASFPGGGGGEGETASVIVVWGRWFIPHLDAGWEKTMKNYLSPVCPLWQILRRWETNGSWGWSHETSNIP